MNRRFLLVPVFTLALAGLAQGQGATQTKVYPIPGAVNGAVGEYETPEQLKVLEEFHQSKLLENFDQALLTSDKGALDRMISDHVVWIGERFGKGENLTKAGVLANFGEKKEVSVAAHTRDHVRLRAFDPFRRAEIGIARRAQVGRKVMLDFVNDLAAVVDQIFARFEASHE